MDSDSLVFLILRVQYFHILTFWLMCRCIVLVCTKQGTVFAFGDNEYGQLGVSDIESTTTPICVSSLSDHTMVQVSCGRYHSAALAGKFTH